MIQPRAAQAHGERPSLHVRVFSRWVVLLILALGTAHAQEADEFAAWLAELRSEALAQGIRPGLLDRALADVTPIPRVIELDRNQPEFTKTFQEYLALVVPPSRVARGRRLLAENRALLDEIYARYGVQPRVIVAFWGIETNFGETLGGFRVIPALATLAHDGRRSTYFRGELLDALHILNEGHITADAMMGSWAGAMGQCQFMPSSFRRYAVDFDGDGRRDIWSSRADVFASAANYLAQCGWQGDRIWGRAVRLPTDFAVPEGRLRLSEWQARGVRRTDGRDLPRAPDLPAQLILPGEGLAPAYLIYDNFEAILKWNRSSYFALAVGILSDRLR